jgi:transposase-like protein
VALGTVRARLQRSSILTQTLVGGKPSARKAPSVQTLFNCVKAHRQGRLKGADSKAISAEQMEISRLRAELARVKMERDILEKATACDCDHFCWLST